MQIPPEDRAIYKSIDGIATVKRWWDYSESFTNAAAQAFGLSVELCDAAHELDAAIDGAGNTTTTTTTSNDPEATSPSSSPSKKKPSSSSVATRTLTATRVPSLTTAITPGANAYQVALLSRVPALAAAAIEASTRAGAGAGAAMAVSCASAFHPLPPLHCAAASGSVAALTSLLTDAKAPVDARAAAQFSYGGSDAVTGGGWTPLMAAVDAGERETAAVLLAAGADPALTEGDTGDTVLAMAVRRSYALLVEDILGRYTSVLEQANTSTSTTTTAAGQKLELLLTVRSGDAGDTVLTLATEYAASRRVFVALLRAAKVLAEWKAKQNSA